MPWEASPLIIIQFNEFVGIPSVFYTLVNSGIAIIWQSWGGRLGHPPPPHNENLKFGLNWGKRWALYVCIWVSLSSYKYTISPTSIYKFGVISLSVHYQSFKFNMIIFILLFQIIFIIQSFDARLKSEVYINILTALQRNLKQKGKTFHHPPVRTARFDFVFFWSATTTC